MAARGAMTARYVRLMGSALLFAFGATAGSMLYEGVTLAREVARPPAELALGSYLAGRIARGQHETDAAAGFYSRALDQDPANEVLLEQSLLMDASEGKMARALPLAQKLAAEQPGHRFARLILGVDEFTKGRFAEADKHFAATSGNPIGDLTALLARAWALAADGKAKEALDLLESPKQPEWAQYYLRYHRALIADVTSRRAEARAAYEKAYKGEQKTLRLALAYAQHTASVGDTKLAQTLLQAHLDKSKGDPHPSARALADRIDAGEPVGLLIKTPAEGLAEVFYGLGEALSGEGAAVGIGAIYLQLALMLEPNMPFALATLANVYEATRRYDTAIEVYDRIPKGTPLETSIEIRKALNLNQLEKVDEAQKLLEDIARRNPKDIRPLDALGSMMRGHKRFPEAVDYYNRLIAMIDKPQAKHWAYYYARGTAYERVKKWPLAEADLQTALRLAPDQAQVLNYLGYSWVDQNRNLKQGMALIEKAVKLKPEDGYIVDSLGWAHYRTGNYKEAAKLLERAVELRPEDPTLNDHLGDAMWRVGREREARYQWEQALTLKPEPEDVDKIKAKLDKGLPSPTLARAPAKKQQQAAKPEILKKRTENRAAPVSPSVQ